MIMRYHQEQQQKEIRAEKEEAQKLKRIASNLAKMVKEFWNNIEKVINVFLFYTDVRAIQFRNIGTVIKNWTILPLLEMV